MAGKLTAALKRFASRSLQVEQEALKNPDFRSLCEDYGETVDALDYWSRSDDPTSLSKVTEYHRLVVELEYEINSYLEAQQGT